MPVFGNDYARIGTIKVFFILCAQFDAQFLLIQQTLFFLVGPNDGQNAAQLRNGRGSSRIEARRHVLITALVGLSGVVYERDVYVEALGQLYEHRHERTLLLIVTAYT